MIYDIADKKVACIGPGFFVAESASVIGAVRLGANASVWFGAVVRGDTAAIDIGDDSNVQDCAVIHGDGAHPVTVGRGVTVGHRAVLHGCTVGDDTLIGIGAIVLNGAVIGKNCIVGAGALVLENSRVPDGSIVLGSPAKVARAVTPEQVAEILDSAAHYVTAGRLYRESLVRREA